MRAGPKAQADLSLLPLAGLPAGGGARVAAFCARFLVAPKGHGAGEPLVLRPWQCEIVSGLFDSPRPWTGLLSLPRGQGKSTLSAALALYALHADGVEGPEVLVVASDERQAGIVLGVARRMTELSPELAARTTVYRDKLVVPRNDGRMFALPSEPGAVEGYDPSLVVVDELAHVREETWESLTGYAGKRPSSLTLAISTPAGSADSLMYRLVQDRRENPSPLHYLREYAAPEHFEIDDEAGWEVAMPALDDFMSREAVRSKLSSLRSQAFERYVLGRWVTAAGGWLPFGVWDAVADPARVVPGGARIVAAFDGSASGDSTVIVGATVEDVPHVFLIGAWENPNDPRWRVPRAEVDQGVAAMFAKFDVTELACDPFGWRDAIERWVDRHGARRVVEVPNNSVPRMAPITDRAYQAIAERRLTHDGSAVLAAHVAHAHAKSTSYGDSLTKDRKNGPNKIDAAVAMVVAVDRAAHYAKRRTRRLVAV